MGKVASIQGFNSIAPRGISSVSKAGSGRAPLWDLWGGGQLLELSGQAPGKLSTAAALVARAQAEGEPVAWISTRDEASFYPPDFAVAGVDLEALVIVRMPCSAGAHGVVRASEVLLRSGAFGLVVIDFLASVPKGELAWQSRLSGLVRMHDARVVLLTGSRAEDPSLGPLIALRTEPAWSNEQGRMVLKQRVLKSKLGGAAAVSPDVRAAPVGA